MRWRPRSIGERSDDAAGVRLIVGYKFVKSAAELLLGALILLLPAAGLADVRMLAWQARDHATAAWSVELAKWLMDEATARHMRVIGLASLLDAASSFVEGWALHRRFRWSGWFVAGTTSSLFPFEIAAIVRHFSAGRIALMAVNVLIVGYLVRRQVSERAG